MLRDLLVPILRQPSDENAIAMASLLAHTHSAHLTTLVTITNPMPLTTEWGYAPAEVNQQAFDAAQQEGQALAARLAEQLSHSSTSFEVRVAASLLLWPEDTLALHASHCDLAVLGGPAPGQSGTRFGLSFTSLLLRSGRPVLVVPHGYVARPIQRAIIAWRPTPEAARAVHDALPLLVGASAVTVLIVDPISSEGGHGDQPGADIARHLARHGLSVDVLIEPRQGRSIGECLLSVARESGADLLVMGGYGHSRWREAILGGATRNVLDALSLPVFFAH